jgi:hypothetical protein
VPNRILRDGILSSDRVDALDAAAEVFYRRLISVVDDFGRFDARTSILISACYPLRASTKRSPRERDVDAWISACIAAGLVVVYQVAGKPFLCLVDFRQQVRAKASKYPEPPAASACESDATHMHSTCEASAHLDGDVVGDVDDKERRQKSAAAKPPQTDPRKPVSRGTRLPDDWELTPELLAFAIEERPDWNEAHARKVSLMFRDYWHAKAGSQGVRTDWAATWRNWVRRESSTPSGAVNGKPASNGAGPPWWASDAGIRAKADELGVNVRPGESWNDLKGRINQVLDERKGGATCH